MRTKPEIGREAGKWDLLPFSFEPSPAMRALLGRRIDAYRTGKRIKPRQHACMCQACGSVLVVAGDRGPAGNKHPEIYCDKECAEADRSRVYRMRRIGDKTVLSKGWMPTSMASKVVFCNCQYCNRRFASAEPRQFCGDECLTKKKERTKKQAMKKWTAEKYLRAIQRRKENARLCSCKQCGIEYTSIRKDAGAYCSRKCTLKYAKKNREHIARASRKIGGGFSDVDVFKAAKWKCTICGIKVHQATGQHSETQATIDHVVPMSKGGLHVWGNVQCACQRCNASKSDKIERPVQMTFL
jgi:5-methylcytosine-specific restriction endonuclease McrA